jgi:SAM-dependent methyltransferase
MTEPRAQSIPGAESDFRFYDELLAEYDQMMDWESRLQREAPFFEKIFHDYPVHSILDVGCGTGRHCFFFDTLGVERIVGADPSEKTLEYARAKAKASGSEIEFIEASFTTLTERVNETFDMVCVLGNSLSHLLKYDDLEKGLRNLRDKITDQGIIVIQMLNWDRRLALKQRFFPPQGHAGPQGEKVFFRFFDFLDELVTMNLVILKTDGSPGRRWTHRVLQTTLRPWRREILRMAVEETGLITEHEFGGTNLSPFDPQESPDYIFICRKK